MQLILEANNISVSTAHFGAFLRFWKNLICAKTMVNTQESKGYASSVYLLNCFEVRLEEICVIV